MVCLHIFPIFSFLAKISKWTMLKRIYNSHYGNGASNVYLLVLPSCKVNIAEYLIAIMGLQIHSSNWVPHIYIKEFVVLQTRTGLANQDYLYISQATLPVNLNLVVVFAMTCNQQIPTGILIHPSMKAFPQTNKTRKKIQLRQCKTLIKQLTN